MNSGKDAFSYDYSAEEQNEIRRIRDKYAELDPESRQAKIEKLRKLDMEAQKPGMIASLSCGIGGALVFGLGFCCVAVWKLIALGICVGIIGALLAAAALPINRIITARKRHELSSEICKLSDGLLQ